MPDDLPLADEQGRLTMAAGQCPAPGTGDAPADAWDTGMPRWDILYGVVFVAVVGVVAATAGSPGRTALAVGATVAMAPWYFLVGRPHMRSEAAGMVVTPRSVTYMTGIVLLFGIAVLLAPNAWFLSIALLPQCYHVLPANRALIPA
ncbi:MAG: hypothetical protein WAL16_24455, partial [Streptosporangiaceae bacterium]